MQQPNLIKIKGVISNLQIWQGETNLLTGNSAAIGETTAIAATTTGLGGAASGAVLNSDSDEDVEYFYCNLGNRVVKGHFKKALIKNGDNVIMAVQVKNNTCECYAICWPATRKILVYPYSCKGSYAFWQSWGTYSLLFSMTIIPLFVILFSLLNGDLINSKFSYFLTILIERSAPGIFVSLLGCLIVTWIFSKYGRLGSNIFNALGFKNPRNVDLPKRLKQHLKDETNDSEKHDEYHPMQAWLYHY